MSVTFLVVPVVVGGWPTMCAAASVAAASLGYKVLEGLEECRIEEVRHVELELENSTVLTGGIREDDELILAKDGVRVRLYKDARGGCAIHVYGRGKSDLELKAEGEELLQQMKKQYAYRRVTEELKNKGFSITGEESGEDGRIRVRFRKFG